MILIITHNNKVLVRGGAFPSGQAKDSETDLEALRRIAREQASCKIGTTWLYDTDVYIACYAGDKDGASAEGFEWLGRDELGTNEWDPAFEQLALQLGAYWDQVFMSEHW